MSNWIPDNAVSYVLHRSDRDCLEIHFFDIHTASSNPLSELPKDLAISDIQQQIRDKPLSERITPEYKRAKNKYDREIKPGVFVDVYEVLDAFKVNSSAIAHAVKKLLAPGQRGIKEERQDLLEARDSIMRKLQQIDEWS